MVAWKPLPLVDGPVGPPAGSRVAYNQLRPGGMGLRQPHPRHSLQ